MSADLNLEVLSEMSEIKQHLSFQTALLERLVARVSDATHVTVREASQILGISTASCRRRFVGVMERIPGGKKDGIPVDRIREAWMRTSVIRAAQQREKRSPKQFAQANGR